MSVEFKIATIDDVEGIIKLCNECFSETTDLEYAKKIYKENEADQNQIYIIGVSNNEIIAHAKINVIPTIYEDMNTYAILNHVCVKPELRREHIGTKMLDVCFKISVLNCGQRTLERQPMGFIIVMVLKLWMPNFLLKI